MVCFTGVCFTSSCFSPQIHNPIFREGKVQECPAPHNYDRCCFSSFLWQQLFRDSIISGHVRQEPYESVSCCCTAQLILAAFLSLNYIYMNLFLGIHPIIWGQMSSGPREKSNCGTSFIQNKYPLFFFPRGLLSHLIWWEDVKNEQQFNSFFSCMVLYLFMPLCTQIQGDCSPLCLFSGKLL